MSNYLYLPDNGDGTYTNPIIFCDYSDPDCICVDGVYYMTASSFNYVPGLPILVSRDLVNWRLANYALRNIPVDRYTAPQHAQGVWAPAIRWHEGMFYIYYGQPDEGIYMVRTADPMDKWEEPVLVLSGKGLIDPCPFWDEDGRAYVIHGYAKSRIGFKSWLGIFPMSPDGTRAIGDDRLLYDGTRHHPTIEGPKVHRRDGWYYIFAPAGGVAEGWQTVLRSRSLHGPYEARIVLRQGNTKTNGPHQGAWVETPEGEHWFLHFQSRGLYGRITHLQPMRWQPDGWPIIGQPEAGETWGVPVDNWSKPLAPAIPERTGEIGRDSFSGPLGLQWQFMGNMRSDFYEVGEGCLRLFARTLPHGGKTLWECPQACTQKIAAPSLLVTVTVDARQLAVGAQAGLGLLGGQYAYIALRRTRDGLSIVYVTSDGTSHTETIQTQINSIPETPVSFRMIILPTGYDAAIVTYEYILDGIVHRIDLPFVPERHTWVGVRVALFSMPLDGGCDGGYADFSMFGISTILNN